MVNRPVDPLQVRKIERGAEDQLHPDPVERLDAELPPPQPWHKPRIHIHPVVCQGLPMHGEQVQQFLDFACASKVKVSSSATSRWGC